MRVIVTKKGTEFSSATFPNRDAAEKIAALLRTLFANRPQADAWQVEVSHEETS